MKGFVLLLWMVFFTVPLLYSQLGFCTGSTGDPIFNEDFGTGLSNGPALPAGFTTYSYVDGTPPDGSYTISSFFSYYDWHNTADHTPGDSNGRALIVNASFTPGEFYRRDVSGLCENTTYQFAAWLLNLLPSPNACSDGGIPINVRFEIWDDSDTQLLASGNTGAIGAMSAPIWENYGLVFQTLPGQNQVILKMINNGAGGCGNDLAIDDISFRSCGDQLTLEDEVNRDSRIVCEEDGPTRVLLEASPDFSVFQSHAYQWQESLDGLNWTDLPGENASTYQSPVLGSDRYYRVKVAEDAINLANSNCVTVSDSYQILIVSAPDPPSGDQWAEFCEGDTGELLAQVASGETANWYDQATGGTPLAEGTERFLPEEPGLYYAEAVKILGGCTSTSRTAFELFYVPLPPAEDQNLAFCEGTTTVLASEFEDGSYLWSTGETTPSIQVSQAGTYTVEVRNSLGCLSVKTIVLEQITTPEILDINSVGRSIRIDLVHQGNFEYSLDGFFFQDRPEFDNQVGGPYVVVVREKSGCGEVRQPFNHLVFPTFFTPNGDNQNEAWIPEGTAGLQSFELRIFDRMGRLIYQSSDPSARWDGLGNGNPLPSSDYWYRVQADGQTYQGHFTLKR